MITKKVKRRNGPPPPRPPESPPAPVFRLEGDIREWHLCLVRGAFPPEGIIMTACGKTLRGKPTQGNLNDVSCRACARTNAFKELNDVGE